MKKTPAPEAAPSTSPAKKAPWRKRLKALGFAGFMFFLLKGMAWLVVFFFFAEGCS